MKMLPTFSFSYNMFQSPKANIIKNNKNWCHRKIYTTENQKKIKLNSQKGGKKLETLQNEIKLEKLHRN